MKKRAVISLSGGMDSTSLLLNLLAKGYEVRVYSFDYGQKHKIELERVLQNIHYLQISGFKQISIQIIDLKSVFNESESALTSDTKVPEGHYAEENMKATVVENRNAIFASIVYGKALAWANKENDIVNIYLGIHAGDHEIYPDCRQEFRDALNHAFKIGNWNSERVHFMAPYQLFNKTSILQDCRVSCDLLDISFDEVLRETNTCYNPDEKGRACGKCGSCVERVEAFINNDVEDPILYVDDWKVVVERVESILKKK